MKRFVVVLLMLVAVALAQDYALTVDGQASPQPAITVEGRIYVPLDVLTAAGVVATLGPGSLTLTLPGSVVTGGANQLTALEGCIGTDFFNGIWRFKVLSLSPITDDPNYPGWALEVEVANGQTQTLQPVFAGLNADADHMHLFGPDGNGLEMTTGDLLNGQKLSFAELPQGGVWRGQLTFHYPFGTPQVDAKQPVKLLVEMRPEDIAPGLAEAGVAFTVSDPSLRVDLTCQE